MIRLEYKKNYYYLFVKIEFCVSLQKLHRT